MTAMNGALHQTRKRREQELTDTFSARRLDTEADSWYQPMYNVDVSNALLRSFRKGLRPCCAANFEFWLKNILQGQPSPTLGPASPRNNGVAWARQEWSVPKGIVTVSILFDQGWSSGSWRVGGLCIASGNWWCYGYRVRLLLKAQRGQAMLQAPLIYFTAIIKPNQAEHIDTWWPAGAITRGPGKPLARSWTNLARMYNWTNHMLRKGTFNPLVHIEDVRLTEVKEWARLHYLQLFFILVVWSLLSASSSTVLSQSLIPHKLKRFHSFRISFNQPWLHLR